MESKLDFWMGEALAEAAKAAGEGEVPVGAVVVIDEQIVSRGHNLIEGEQDATAHAEILVLRSAAKSIGNWRLSEASLFVTLEPCSMCVGAMLLSRLGKLYFGCDDLRQGAAGSLFDLTAHRHLPHKIEVHSGLRADESRDLLQRFFRSRR